MPGPPYHGPLTWPRLGGYCNRSHLTWGPYLGAKPLEPTDKDGQATVSSPDQPANSSYSSLTALLPKY